MFKQMGWYGVIIVDIVRTIVHVYSFFATIYLYKYTPKTHVSPVHTPINRLIIARLFDTAKDGVSISKPSSDYQFDDC